jgi:hypothetical protein
MASDFALRGVATLRYQFPTWSGPRGGRTPRGLLTRPSARRWRKRIASGAECRSRPDRSTRLSELVRRVELCGLPNRRSEWKADTGKMRRITAVLRIDPERPNPGGTVDRFLGTLSKAFAARYGLEKSGRDRERVTVNSPTAESFGRARGFTERDGRFHALVRSDDCAKVASGPSPPSPLSWPTAVPGRSSPIS